MCVCVTRSWFFWFVISLAMNCSYVIYLVCCTINVDGFNVFYVLALLQAIAFGLLSWALTATIVRIQTQYTHTLTHTYTNVCTYIYIISVLYNATDYSQMYTHGCRSRSQLLVNLLVHGVNCTVYTMSVRTLYIKVMFSCTE
jgi:hypothetical protein